MSKFSQVTKEALGNIDAGNLKPVANNREEVVAWYQFKPLSETAGAKAAQLLPGTVIEGVYQRTTSKEKTVTLKATGRPKTFTDVKHFIKTADGIVAIPGTALLNALMSKRNEGAKVQITYKGFESYTNKQGKAQDAHGFFVAGGLDD